MGIRGQSLQKHLYSCCLEALKRSKLTLIRFILKVLYTFHIQGNEYSGKVLAFHFFWLPFSCHPSSYWWINRGTFTTFFWCHWPFDNFLLSFFLVALISLNSEFELLIWIGMICNVWSTIVWKTFDKQMHLIFFFHTSNVILPFTIELTFPTMTFDFN